MSTPAGAARSGPWVGHRDAAHLPGEARGAGSRPDWVGLPGRGHFLSRDRGRYRVPPVRVPAGQPGPEMRVLPVRVQV